MNLHRLEATDHRPKEPCLGLSNRLSGVLYDTVLEEIIRNLQV